MAIEVNEVTPPADQEKLKRVYLDKLRDINEALHEHASQVQRLNTEIEPLVAQRDVQARAAAQFEGQAAMLREIAALDNIALD